MQGETSANDAPVIGVLTDHHAKWTRQAASVFPPTESHQFLPILDGPMTRICIACDGLSIHSIAVLVMNSKLCFGDMLVNSNGHGRLAAIDMICEGRR